MVTHIKAYFLNTNIHVPFPSLLSDSIQPFYMTTYKGLHTVDHLPTAPSVTECFVIEEVNVDSTAIFVLQKRGDLLYVLTLRDSVLHIHRGCTCTHSSRVRQHVPAWWASKRVRPGPTLCSSIKKNMASEIKSEPGHAPAHKVSHETKTEALSPTESTYDKPGVEERLPIEASKPEVQ